MRPAFFAAALFFGLSSLAQAEAGHPNALAELKKIAAAAHQLNYRGTFIYQYGDHVETSRIVHLKNAGGEHEKVESLDGSPREIVRTNDQVLCFKPDGDAGVSVLEKRTEKIFPALLPVQTDGIGDNYRVRNVGEERVAGYHCNVIALEPKDQYRYRLKLWADRATGLLLKAATYNENNELVGQFVFTQVEMGGQIDKAALKPKIAGRKIIVSSGLPAATELRQNDLVWKVSRLPPGFAPVTMLKRVLPGKNVPVNQLVFSDGLATVSVFIEPLPSGAKPPQGSSRQGAVNFYMRTLADHQVIVLGEVPAATVAQIGKSVVSVEK